MEEPSPTFLPVTSRSRDNPSEKPRSTQLSKLLRAELAGLEVNVFTSALPGIVPHGKATEQDVDLACAL